MNRMGRMALFVLLTMVAYAAGQGSLHKDVDVLGRHGRATPEGRAAWDRLSQAGPEAIVPLLEGMNTPDTVRANWLRTAFEPVVERELKTGGKRIDAETLLTFVRDTSKQGRTRRLALEVVEKLRPGTSEKLYSGWRNDPEFRFDAVARLLNAAGDLLKTKASTDAEVEFRLAWDAARDQQQLRDAAAGLAQLGITVSVAKQMGFLTDWFVIGPFDSMGQKGFHLEYPPERKVDLSAELPGQGRKVGWKRVKAREPAVTARGGHQALISLADKDALGNADDAVAFAYTEILVPKPVDAEFRGAADDNLTVWVNGKKVFGFEEWRNGVRLDRHRFKVQLQGGKNTLLVKVCQSAAPNPEPNWEFFLRIVDATGQGIAMKNGLAE